MAVQQSKADSFSFVTEPADATRFLADLPLRPATPPATAGLGGISEDSTPSPIASTSRVVAAPASTTASSFTPASRSPEIASHGRPVAATFSASSSASEPRMDNRSSSQQIDRASTKRTKRLSASITGLLKKDKSRSRSAGRQASDDRSASALSPPSAEPASPRTSTDSSRRPSLEDAARSPSSSPSPSPPGSTSPHARSKPPVSLPSLFRRRPSTGSMTSPTSPIFADDSRETMSPTERGTNRNSFERDRPVTGLGLSSTSLASSDGGLLSSDTSTAATSPDIESADAATPLARPGVEALTGAEKRRRSSLVLAQELAAHGPAATGEEDLSTFVRASGATSPSPTTSTGPFARRPSSSFAAPLSTPADAHGASLVPPGAARSASPEPPAEVPESTIAARRMTRNIENLNLGDLGRRSPLSTAPSALAADDASRAGVRAEGSASPPDASAPALSSDMANRSRSSTQARLGSLPRLLSMDVIPTRETDEDEEQEPDEEMESDTEDGDTPEGDGEGESETATEETSEDEGDHYASADEGPATNRSVTPAQTPRATTSRNASTERFASASATPRVPSLTGLAMFAGTTGSSSGRDHPSWVTFAPLTPGTVRTARPQPASTDSANQSYFDLPRPSSSNRTPGIPPQTPLAPMSMSDVARGKRPALQDEVDEAAAIAAQPARVAPPSTGPSTDDASARHGLYRLKSQSEVALMSPSMVDSDDEPIGTAAITGLDSIWRTGGAQTPGPSFLTKPASPVKPTISQPPLAPLEIPKTPGPPPKPRSPISPSSPVASSPTHARHGGRSVGGTSRLHRPRSMYELRDAPPAYTSIARQPGFGPQQPVQPREEEGKEGLPQYTCSIHIEGFMPRKMEFTSPGVQARDRAWKRQYIVLHGTSIKVYKYDLRTHPIPGEQDWSVVPVDIAGKDGPPPLHFHEGEYGVEAAAPGHRFPLSIEDAKAKAKSRIIQQATASSTNQLLRHYSLQNAESGLAADYIKRKHVVRVRAEGEQFLLQAKDDRGVIDLIEALQAATNVALDLDARPLPKFITLPRRRRRRRPRPDAAAAAPTGDSAAGAASGSSSAAATPERGRGSPDRFAEMADEDRAVAAQNNATVM
ncbi:hypothetical protein JCM10212_006655 [Sporobolomyces blumeae]